MSIAFCEGPVESLLPQLRSNDAPVITLLQAFGLAVDLAEAAIERRCPLGQHSQSIQRFSMLTSFQLLKGLNDAAVNGWLPIEEEIAGLTELSKATYDELDERTDQSASDFSIAPVWQEWSQRTARLETVIDRWNETWSAERPDSHVNGDLLREMRLGVQNRLLGLAVA